MTPRFTSPSPHFMASRESKRSHPIYLSQAPKISAFHFSRSLAQVRARTIYCFGKAACTGMTRMGLEINKEPQCRSCRVTFAEDQHPGLQITPNFDGARPPSWKFNSLLTKNSK